MTSSQQRRIALMIQYMGTGFHGWQRQPNERSVQGDIEAALDSVLGRPTTLHGAGRTDAGVHAAAMVGHFDAIGPIPAHRWASVLNSRLADDVVILASAPVASDWHARFSASSRRYRYTLYTDPKPNLFLAPYTWHYYQEFLDVDLMRNALCPLVGRHHLAAFHRTGSNRPHSWVDVHEVQCQRRGEVVDIEVQASGFLYGMMRLLVGMLVQVGRRIYTPESFTEIWQQEWRDRVKYAAPARGLCLLSVGYPESPFPERIGANTLPHFLIPSV
ncbi:MAG: tRNA pseudouridine(38-40) synthase TruA [Cyanobacteria bacterium P01_C01_bin.89]